MLLWTSKMGMNLRISVTMSHLMAIGPLLLLNLSVSAQGVSTLAAWLNTYCPDCAAKSHQKTGVYILEAGEDALLARARG